MQLKACCMPDASDRLKDAMVYMSVTGHKNLVHRGCAIYRHLMYCAGCTPMVVTHYINYPYAPPR